MIYVTSSESEGISMPYLYIVFMIPQWASCIFYLFGTLWHCQIVTLPLLSWHMINFTQICSRFFSFLSAEKKVESHPMWPFFFGWSMGLAGIFGCKPDGFLMVFWSNKFRFSKRFLLKTHSKVSAGNFRVKGWWVSGGNFNPTFGIACKCEEHPVLRWVACQTTSQKLFKIIHYDFFLSKGHGHFFNLTLLSKKRVTHDSQMVPEKNHHQTSATFEGDFRISSRVFSSHSSVRDFPVLGCSRYGS